MLGQLLNAWADYDRSDEGVVVADLIATLYPRSVWPMDDASVAMRGALENLVGCSPGKIPGARQVGARLKHFRRRPVSGRFLDYDSSEYRRTGAVWRVKRA